MKLSKVSIAIQLLLIFFSGVVVGGLAYRFYSSKTAAVRAPQQTKKGGDPSGFRKRYIDEMRSRLELSGDQVQKLSQIMDSTRSQFVELRKRNDQEMRSLQEDQQEQIRAMLNQKQAAEYDLMLAERERQRQERQKEQQDQQKDRLPSAK